MRVLIVEDDTISRKILLSMLSPLALCDSAPNGKEAVEKFAQALNEDRRYQLICMDIMMPEMNGQEALKEIRKLEKEHGILGFDGVKIIMTTALSDSASIQVVFREQCEGYLIKPIEKEKLVNLLVDFGLVKKKK